MSVFPFDTYLAEPEAGSHASKQFDAYCSSQLHFQLPSFLSGDSSDMFSTAMFPGFAGLAPRATFPGSFHDDSVPLLKSNWNKEQLTYHQMPSEKEPAMPFHYSDSPAEVKDKTVAPIIPKSVPEAVYSQSGFDMLSLLGRVAARPNPFINLGPVDLTCAFVVSDNRSPDYPIIYASRTFSELTGYEETEILGRNCRFLQAPGGAVSRGSARRYTSTNAVSDMMWAISDLREVQVTLVNYRKDGQPFVNRVSVIPVDNYFVGFQVDLNIAPAKLPTNEAKLFPHNHSSNDSLSIASSTSISPAELSAFAMSAYLRPYLFSKELQTALSRSILRSSCGDVPDSRDVPSWLSFLLLREAPDFVQVVSLKGSILYASPNVRRSLGYTPDRLIGSTLSEFAHPTDSVPLLRELKEASTAVTATSHDDNSDEECVFRTVDLLFRLRHACGNYVWVAAMGRLHSEPGKGRKAIILSGRVCTSPSLTWGAIAGAGGVLLPSIIRASNVNGSSLPLSLRITTNASADKHDSAPAQEREFWALLSSSGIFLSVGAGVRDILGWGAGEVMGRAVQDFMAKNNLPTHVVAEAPFSFSALKPSVLTPESPSHPPVSSDLRHAISQIILDRQSPPRRVPITLVHHNTTIVPLEVILYATSSEAKAGYPRPSQRHSEHVFAQFRMNDSYSSMHGSRDKLSHDLSENVFDEIQPERPTSWQYELQKLKFANRDLRTEVIQLEKYLGS